MQYSLDSSTNLILITVEPQLFERVGGATVLDWEYHTIYLLYNWDGILILGSNLSAKLLLPGI